MKYIPLNIKTEYDLMNSLIKLDDLFSYAKNNGIDTIGITDTNMFGDYEFINKCKNNNIKPIIGIEINNILIYARNYDGYVALCKIVSKKNIYDDLDIDYIYKFDSDIILVVNYNDYSNYDKFTHVYVGYKNENEKRNALLITKDIVYIPLIRYFNESDKEYFKYIKYIDGGKTIDEEIEIEDTYFIDNNNSEDIRTTINFSNMINIELKESTYHIPVYKENSKEFLRALAKKGLEKRLNNIAKLVCIRFIPAFSFTSDRPNISVIKIIYRNYSKTLYISILICYNI